MTLCPHEAPVSKPSKATHAARLGKLGRMALLNRPASLAKVNADTT